MLKLIISAIFLLSPFLVHAEDLDRELNLRMKIFSALSQVEKRAQIEFSNTTHLEGEEFTKKWHGFFKKEAQNYINELEKELVQGSEAQKKFSLFKAKIDWNALSTFGLNQFTKLKHLAREKGISIVFVCILNTAFQFTVPPFLISIGQPFLAIVLYYMASDIPIVFAHHMTQKLALQYRMYKLIGNKEQFFSYSEINKKIRENLKLSTIDDLIVPIDFNSSLVIEESSAVKNILRRLGLSKGKITIRRLQDFLEQQGMYSPIFESIIQSKRISQENKMALISLQFFEIANAEQIGQFKYTFHNSLIDSARVSNLEVTKKWLDQLLSSRSYQDLMTSIDNTPHELSQKEIAQIWETIILPELSKRPEYISYRPYRRLLKNFVPLKATIYTSDLDETQLKNLFKELFEQSLLKNTGRCLKGQDQIILKLLGQSY